MKQLHGTRGGNGWVSLAVFVLIAVPIFVFAVLWLLAALAIAAVVALVVAILMMIFSRERVQRWILGLLFPGLRQPATAPEEGEVWTREDGVQAKLVGSGSTEDPDVANRPEGQE